MKSTLKIDEFEIILEGVDDQWLKHNHRYIVEAIIAAFEPFDHREFNENVINELVIELPKSHSFNQFLDDLLHKLRSEIVDKNVIRKGENETSALPKPISNWQTIENLYDRLKNQSGSNSNLYQQTLNEILSLVKTNEQLVWEFIAKLDLPKQFLEKFKSWILVEKIHPNLIILWMGSFIEIQKKNQHESPDAILLKIIYQSVYNQNQQGLTIANLQNAFVKQLLKIPNQSPEETVEYQSSISDLNNIFSSYFNEYDVIKNLINIDFIEKIIQLNTANPSRSKSKQKIEILMFFAALKIANSLNITQYAQLIEALNQAYSISNKGQFNEQFILQIFKQYLPTNQHNILASLFEMTFEETKLFNLNNDIETSIVQLFTKIERFVFDNQNEINENSISVKENTFNNNFKLTQEYIIEQIIQFNFFKTWPEEINFLKPILQQYFTQLLTNNKNTFEFNQLPFPISATGEIAFKELANILNKILKIKSKNPTQFQNLLFEYATVINLLILNLLDFQQPKFLDPSTENKDKNVSTSFKKDTKDKFQNLKKLNETAIPFNEYFGKSPDNESTLENKIQQVKETLSKEIITNIEQLKIQNTSEIELKIFTNQELRLWESFINLIEANEINTHKLKEQLANFESAFQIISEFWLTQQNSNQPNEIQNKFNVLKSLSEILEIKLHSIFTLKSSINQEIIASQIFKHPLTLKLFSYVESLEQRKTDISNPVLMNQIDGIQSIVLLESIKVILFDLLNQFVLNRANDVTLKIALSNLPKTDSSATIKSLLNEINEIDRAIKLIRDSIQFKIPNKYKEINLNRNELKKVSESNLTLNEKEILFSILNVQISDVLQQELESNTLKVKNIELQTAVELNQINELIQIQNNVRNRNIIDMVDSLNNVDQQFNDVEIIKKWNLQEGINRENKNVIPILIGEIILKIRAPWFNYLNKFAVNNEQTILISKQLNWFNQFIEQNIVLNIQPAQNELIQKYIREIEASNLQKYELKEHLYIQNIFNLILQFIEQNDRIKIETTQILGNKFVKNLTKITSIFQSALEIHNQVLSIVIIQNYAQRSEIDIATESKNIIQKIFHSPINETSEWTPKNIWFQTENKIPIASIFNDQEIWRILFYEKSDAIYVQNESNVITPIWKQSEHLKMLLKHPDSKKWMVELSKNKGEGFMDLASTLSMDAILEAHQEKYKAPNHITLNIQSLLVDLKTILSDNAILEFYQFSKFQILQTQAPLSKIYLSQIYYLSYLSVSSKKTIPEISQFAKLIFEKLELNNNEKGIIQKFINEKLPSQSSIENIENDRISVEEIAIQKSSNKIDSKSTRTNEMNIDDVQYFKLSNQTKEYLIKHLLKYPSIGETELIDQIQLLLNITLKPKQISFLLRVISIEIWQQLNKVSREKSTQKQESQFLNKVVSNWLRFKLLHFTIKHAYSNVEQWIIESKQILQTVNVSKIDAVHFNWLLFDEKIKSEISEIATNASLFYQFTPENIENVFIQNKNNSIEKALEPELKNKETEEYRTDPIKMIGIENEVFTELIQWKEEINSRINIPQKKAIENQQNKDEYHLELPIQNREPNIMDWEQLNTSENIINSIITILLKEGIQLKIQEKYNEEFIRINQFLSSKAFYRILGNSSVPLQFIGMFYEQFFGYSMGLIEEDWKGFVQPKKSHLLVEKLRLIREGDSLASKDESWFEKLLNFTEYEEGKSILGVQDFNLILIEIQNAIQQKLTTTKFNNAHESLKENWIQHLIFFKILQFKSKPDSIGSFYAILESDQTQNDKWIHQISDHILFDINVEYDFWIENLSRFGNYFEESNIIALFQLSESLKLINSEIKLSIEDILAETLRMSENRPFDVAISNVFIPKLVPLFYENHLSKTTQFRELNLLSLILSERNTISSKPQEISKDEIITLDELFKEFNSEENLNIDPEILKEISLIIGKNLDETSRWILHELAQSSAKKLNEFAQKIHETHQSEVKIKTYYQSIINNPKLSSTIQDLISPIIINLKETKKSDSKIKSEIDNGTRFVTTLCGLMMLSPFFATLFRRMGLLEKNEFVSEKEQLKAYKVLMAIPKIDEEQVYEYQDLIPRIITGIAPEDTINYIPELTEEELAEIRNFLGAVISQWPVMANATVRGFIESFLVRDGKVWKEGSLWKIEVNGHGADIVLQTLTWGFSTMKFPWTPYMIETNWLAP